MLSFIPHKNNPYKLRSFVGTFVVFIFSVAVALGVNVYLHKVKAKAELQQEKPAEFSMSTNQSEIVPVFAPESQFIENQVVIEDEKNVTQDVQEIVPPPATIERGKNPGTRIDEAKMYAKPVILEGKYIDISLAYQNMVLFENGKLLDAYMISSGKRGLETPQGTFKIENKSPRAWSKTYSLWMPNWMAILPTGKVGIHELPVWPSGYQEGANHLGIPVSHGCVRLGPGSAKRVYDWAEIGTPVIVHK